jgi:hypothetical protein
MKRIHIENEFTQWAEYLARYFGEDLLIYDKKGVLMWGKPDRPHKRRLTTELGHQQGHTVETVITGFYDVVAYLDYTKLTGTEEDILRAIVPFIESQLEDEGA